MPTVVNTFCLGQDLLSALLPERVHANSCEYVLFRSGPSFCVSFLSVYLPTVVNTFCLCQDLLSALFS